MVLLSGLRRVTAALPQALPLPDASWRSRHRAILVLLWLHIVALPAIGWALGQHPRHIVVEVAVVTLFAVVGTQPSGSRRLRAIAAVLGLLTTSALLVHASEGLTEMHFHFFVVIAVVTMYQDWAVFASAIAFIALHHGALGALGPHEVYSHSPALWSPWKLAAVQGAFVLTAGVVHATSRRFVEDQYKRAEAAIRRREGRFRSLIENSSDGITVVAADGTIVYDSPSVPRLLGYEADSRAGSAALDYVLDADLPVASAMLEDLIAAGPGAMAAAEVRVLHVDGTARWMEVRASNLLDQPDLQGIVINFRDSTDRKKLESDLAHQAFHDPLTGLANRALFLDRITHAQATQRRTAQHLAVIFIDLDDFKTVNDGMGHAAGDVVLISVADRLRSCVRDADTCARLGGDEFGILLEGLDGPAEVYDLGARLLEAMAEEIEIDGKALVINASLGIVVAAGDEDPASLVRNADLAMYQAKAGGKGRFAIFELGMYDAAVERLELRAAMRAAVDGEQFTPYYQPVIDLRTGAIVGAEALVRWNHPTRGLLPPAAFLELAEETGLIVEIGRSVLRQACRDAARWGTTGGQPLTVAVNLSTVQLREPTLLADVAAALEDFGLEPARLTLEVTETTLMENPDVASERLHQLKGLGVKVALDDFGTGFSSLSYLQRFPVDRLKIDKSFTDALAGAGSPEDVTLVGAIAGLGNLLNLAVTAEGIERYGQVGALLSLGCTTGQGFYFAAPVTSSHFSELVDEADQDTHAARPAERTVTAAS